MAQFFLLRQKGAPARSRFAREEEESSEREEKLSTTAQTQLPRQPWMERPSEEIEARFILG
jgi:hypothetical protein